MSDNEDDSSENDSADDESNEDEEQDSSDEEDEDEKSIEPTEDDIDKDIQLLRDIGAYIERTSRRIKKRIVQDMTVQRRDSLVKIDAAVQAELPFNTAVTEAPQQLPPYPPMMHDRTQNPLGIPQRDRFVESSLADYEYLSETERNKLINDAISALLSDRNEAPNR